MSSAKRFMALLGKSRDFYTSFAPVFGSNLIGNSTFDDTSWWSNDGISISGGMANWDTSSALAIYKSSTVAVGSYYKIVYEVKNYVSGTIRASVGTIGKYETSDGIKTGVVKATSTPIEIKNLAAATKLSVDSVYLYKLNEAQSVKKTKSTIGGDFIITTKLIIPSGFIAGLVFNIDNISTPTSNSVWVEIARGDQTESIRISKYVNGTYTLVRSVSVTYAENAELQVRKVGSEYRVYYNGTQLMLDTISDATIVDNTTHAQFTTSENVIFTSLTVRNNWYGTLPYNIPNVPAVYMSFDDGIDNVYTNAFSYMASKNVVGTFYIITNKIDTAGYITTAQLQEMQADGWSIANHTRTHPDLRTLTLEQQEAEISAGKDNLLSAGITGNDPYHVAYPGGWNDANTPIAMANAGMLTGRAVTANRFAFPYSDKYLIPTTLIINTLLLSEVTALVDTVLTERKILSICFHEIVETPSTQYQWSIANFEGLIDYIISKKLTTLTIDEMHRLTTGSISINHL